MNEDRSRNLKRRGAYIPKVIPESDIKMMEKFGGGYLVGFGRKIAVLVVDMTINYVEDRYSTGYSITVGPAIEATKKLLDKARQIGIPIFYTKGAPRSGAEKGRWPNKVKPKISRPKTPEAYNIVEDIKPLEGDIVITKPASSAFFGTHLESFLNYHGVDTLIVTGVVTSGCVRATVVDAFSYNYRVIVPIECVADRADISHQVSLFDMSMKFADVIPLSSVLKHLEDADRTPYQD